MCVYLCRVHVCTCRVFTCTYVYILYLHVCTYAYTTYNNAPAAVAERVKDRGGERKRETRTSTYMQHVLGTAIHVSWR